MSVLIGREKANDAHSRLRSFITFLYRHRPTQPQALATNVFD